jgi:hypothetical protein
MHAWLKMKKEQATAGYCRKGLKNLTNLKGCLSDRILLRQKNRDSFHLLGKGNRREKKQLSTGGKDMRRKASCMACA